MTRALGRVLALDPTEGFAEELRLQALIVAVHALAPRPQDTDWPLAATFYDRLAELAADDPVVRLNRAVVTAEISGPHAALDQVREIPAAHHRVAGVLAEFHGRAGEWREAATLYRRAADWCANTAVRRHYERRHADAVAKITLAQ